MEIGEYNSQMYSTELMFFECLIIAEKIERLHMK